MEVLTKEQIEEAANYLQNRGVHQIDTAIVLGTGLSATSIIEEATLTINYSEIPGMPTSTVEGHDGTLVYGKRNSKWILILKGRLHYYEGYNMEQITFYVHVLAQMKCRVLFITNASGGLNPHYKAGDLVLVTDHINLFSQHPLRGQWPAEFGPRFPDMLHAYPIWWQDKFIENAVRNNISLRKGIYLGWQGPSLETPAEYRMARLLGADLVGMSTVPEVIVAKFRSLDVAVISVVSNVCFPISKLTPTTIEEVLQVMKASAQPLADLINAVLDDLD
ncbi:MAG: purine-nucleoside phosphorylase [Saprospiraceae bacterium]|nr:purine-nucleoside phosphorylase [Saprospiraceae bacterium]